MNTRFIFQRYEVDLESAFLFLNGAYGPEFVKSWEDLLSRAVVSLPDFPGPRANAIDEEASAIFQCEVRRFLYYGPGKRRPMRTPYRVLYTIIEPQDISESFIRILRLIHGSRPTQMLGEA